jgi:hypothetical protein
VVVVDGNPRATPMVATMEDWPRDDSGRLFSYHQLHLFAAGQATFLACTNCDMGIAHHEVGDHTWYRSDDRAQSWRAVNPRRSSLLRRLTIRRLPVGFSWVLPERLVLIDAMEFKGVGGDLTPRVSLKQSDRP